MQNNATNYKNAEIVEAVKQGILDENVLNRYIERDAEIILRSTNCNLQVLCCQRWIDVSIKMVNGIESYFPNNRHVFSTLKCFIDGHILCWRKRFHIVDCCQSMWMLDILAVNDVIFFFFQFYPFSQQII